MNATRPLRIGISCYPSFGGSGILASALGEELAQRGHEIHFISYERPVRLPENSRLFFHPVRISSYDLFRYPDFSLPLAVTMADVSSRHGLDILHVHYAVPHATAALLALDLLPPERRPKLVTTLHGTDTTLFGRDRAYGPAIRHALDRSDRVTAVSEYLRRETQQVLAITRPIEVIHNFFKPRLARRSREQVRDELGVRDEALIVHSSNLRPLKRVDLLLEAAARLQDRVAFKLLILAGAPFSPFEAQVKRLQLGDRLLVRELVIDIEEYLQAADLGLFASDAESFGLSILEAMCFGCPSVATAVGGIAEVVQAGVSGILVPPGDLDALVAAVEGLVRDPARCALMGAAARRRSAEFSPEIIVPRYERLYLDALQKSSG